MSADQASETQDPRDGLRASVAADGGGAADDTDQEVAVSSAGAPAVGPHGPDCPCVRCTGFQPGHDLGFQPGHQLSRRHGGYAVVALQGRASEIAESLAQQASADADRASLELAALTLARIEAANAAIDAAPIGERAGLERHLRSWIKLGATQLAELGLSPAGRARLVRDGGIGVGMAGGADMAAVAGAADRLRAKLAEVMADPAATYRGLQKLGLVHPDRQYEGVIEQLRGRNRQEEES